MADRILRGWSVRLLRAFTFSALVLAALSPFSLKAEESAALTTAVSVDGNGLPIILSPGDVTLYQEIFALQQDGKWAKADELIAQLENDLLMGHVLAQRYLHPTDYRSKYKELKAWLEKYADLPEAERIYELAKKRKPSGAANPPSPQISELSVSGPAKPSIQPYKSDRQRSSAQRSRVNQIMKEIKALVKDDKLTKAQKLLEGSEAQKLLDPVEIDQSYTEIARGWYFEGDNERALELAGPAADRSGSYAPYANWYAGLAAWRLGDMETAANHFEQLALSDRANAWVQAAGAYWAARAHLRRRDPGEMSLWLSLAAEYPRTFYGLLAREALGMKTEFDFRAFRLTTSGVEMLASAPHGARAMALLQVGERELAEQELMMLEVWDSADVAEVLLAIADQAKLARFAFKLANKLADAEGNGQRGMPLLAALYPVPHWEPEGDYLVDRALVYALIRQESAFDPDAISHAGARGLMQIMPRTASYVAGDPNLKGKGKNELYDPELNLRLGQEYLVHLLTLPEVQGDLFRLCAAYNGGPGNLARWQRETDFKDDPLLFIESLPSGETRDYIERVLANLWIYSARLEQPTPSLTDIANGDWPKYRSLDSLTAQAQ